MKPYEISLEISGPTAMWTRPDTGDSPVSYPVPTWSAAKGIFESIVRIETVEVVPTMVEICAPIVYHSYATNYGGPLREIEAVKKRNNYQLFATVLINVCYRLYGELRHVQLPYELSQKAQERRSMGCNALHAYQDIFNRRLQKGQFYDVPFLGWREFIPNYIGPFRAQTKVQEDMSVTMQSFLFSVFDQRGLRDPVYTQEEMNRKIINGRLQYAERA